MRLCLVVLAVIFGGLNHANAQPLGARVDSIETTVANADAVFVGSLRSNAITREGDFDLLVFDVFETLKGSHLKTREVRPPHGTLDVLISQSGDKMEFLVLCTDSPGKYPTFVSLSSDADQSMLTSDFQVLTSGISICKYVRNCVTDNPSFGRLETVELHVPSAPFILAKSRYLANYKTGGGVTLRVPIDKRLEVWAKSVLLQGERKWEHAFETRTFGDAITSLKFFKSDANIEILNAIDVNSKQYGEECRATLEYWGEAEHR